jgi:glycosyltransferase involved in cell wall biosynthesis
VRLGVFHTVTANPFGGTFTVREDIFEGLATAIGGSGHELVVFTNDASAASRVPSKGVSWVNVGRLRSRALLSIVKKRVNRVFSHGLLLPEPFAGDSWLDPFILDAGVDLFVNLGPDAISTAVPYVCAVFDLQHRSQPFMPEVNVRGYWERWEEQYRLNVSRAAFVINGTRAGTDEIVRLYRVPREKIVQLRLPTPEFALAAAKEPQQPRPAYLKPEPFVFYPAQYWPHKNHVTLLDALSLLRREHGLDVQAVLVGSDQGNKAFVRERIAALGLADTVHVRGFVERTELVALYQHALAMMCVSTCGPESLPTLEAFALGCPVVNTDVPGVDEQFGAAALIVSSTDPEGMAGAMLTLNRDAARREAMIAAGRVIAAERTGARFARGLLDALGPFAQARKNWSSRRHYGGPLRVERTFSR